MIEGQVVSRTDLFGEFEKDPEELTNSVNNSAPVFDFVEVDVASDIPVPTETVEPSNDLLEFQLFAGSQPAAISLVEPQEKEMAGRPPDFYLYQTTPSLRHSFAESAVSGDFVRKEALFWINLAAKNPPAPDINHNYTPNRRKCRPGKQTRLNKKLKNERLAMAQKLANERIKQQRRRFAFRKKPRG